MKLNALPVSMEKLIDLSIFAGNGPCSLLFAPEVVPSVLSIARHLSPSTGTLLECRLGVGSVKVDLSLRILANDGSWQQLASLHHAFRRKRQWRKEPAWQYVYEVCEKWLDEKSPIYEPVEVIWLEFDYDNFTADIPLPCVFIGTTYPNAINQTLFEQLIESWSPVQRDFSCYFDALPEGAWIRQVGAMFSRGRKLEHDNRRPALRLCTTLPLNTVLTYLSKIAWCGDEQTLKAILKEISIYTHQVTLHLDIGQIFSNTIGIEFCPDDGKQWRAVLASLVDKGLCTADKCHALLAWAGHSYHFDDPKYCQSDFLLQTIDKHTPAKDLVYVRRLNHLKFVIQADSKVEVKGYLYSGYGVLRDMASACYEL
jgi:hypothetical protein